MSTPSQELFINSPPPPYSKMELEQYQTLFDYLTNQQYPDGYSDKKKNQLKKAATYFEIHNNRLWHKSEQDATQLQRVIKITELEAVLYNSHDNPLGGHLQFETTYNGIAVKYYWYGMRRTIQNDVTKCETCQRDGARRKNELLRTIKIGQPFERIGINIVGPLPKTSQGNVHIVVAVDYLTKWPEARAIPDATAESVAKFFYEDIICRHGCPKEIVSDNGSAFISQLVEKLLQQHQIKHRLISPYHPQTNGLVERFNRTLCKAIAKYVQLVEEEWDKFIPSVLFAYRTMKHNTTKFLFKWVGPYTIHEVFGNGAYRLRTMDGKILKSTTNGNDMKKYHTRDLPEPRVIIE